MGAAHSVYGVTLMGRWNQSLRFRAQGQAVCLLMLVGAFAVGLLAGSLFARMGGSADWTQLSICVERCLEGERPGFFSTLSVTLRYPLLLILSGITLWGVWAAPVVLAFRGFFLSYTVACFAMVYGGRGYILSLTLVLFHGIAMLPVLFALGQWSMERALAKKYKRMEPRFERQEALLCTVVSALVLASSLLETVLLPVLFGWVRALTGI